MATVNQPTINPTNKLTASVVAVAVIELARVLVHNFWPGFDDAGLWTALSPVAVFAIGYFIKDEATVVLATPVVSSEEAPQPVISYADLETK